MPSSYTSLRAVLALQHFCSLTDKQLRILLLAVDSAETVFTLSRDELHQLGLPPQAASDLASVAKQQQAQPVEQDLAAMARLGVELIAIFDPRYPALLREIYDPPLWLYCLGDVTLLENPQLAIVGSRHTTAQGARNAKRFAAAFAERGFTVTSGMALGIDAQSHRAALDAGGSSIAVLGAGVDVVYPRRNQSLYRDLAAQGLLVSEFPLGRPPLPAQFPQRNRIISGLSLGVLVVEAAIRSGSLITARCALEQGREVFAIPGSIHNTGSRGCHQVIRQGGKLVETVDHVFEELLGWLPPEQSAEASTTQVYNVDSELLTLLNQGLQDIDQLQQQSGLDTADLLAQLAELEVLGLVEQVAGRYQRLAD